MREFCPLLSPCVSLHALALILFQLSDWIDGRHQTQCLSYCSLPRKWLSYSSSHKALFCTICLAFAKEENILTEGVDDWDHGHGYLHIQRHGTSNAHNRAAESYMMFDSRTDIESLLND